MGIEGRDGHRCYHGNNPHTCEDCEKRRDEIREVFDTSKAELDPTQARTTHITQEKEQALCAQYGFSCPNELYQRYPNLKPRPKRRSRKTVKKMPSGSFVEIATENEKEAEK